MYKYGTIISTLELIHTAMQTFGAFIEQHLPRQQVDGHQLPRPVVLDLNGPRLVIAVVLMCYVHNRRNHVGVYLADSFT